MHTPSADHAEGKDGIFRRHRSGTADRGKIAGKFLGMMGKADQISEDDAAHAADENPPRAEGDEQPTGMRPVKLHPSIPRVRLNRLGQTRQREQTGPTLDQRRHNRTIKV